MDPDAVGVTDLPGALETLVRSAPWLLAALRAARDVDPPDWLIGGGALRTLVWDHLHGRSRPAPPRDVDLAFYDPGRLDPARDAEVEAALAARLPGIPWDAKNQAAVHTWYDRVFGGQVAPLHSAATGSPPGRRRPPRSPSAWTATTASRSSPPAAWRTCSAWSAAATPAGSPWSTTTSASATSGSRSAGQGSRSCRSGPRGRGHGSAHRGGVRPPRWGE
jgi:Nucleotidyltransferase